MVRAKQTDVEFFSMVHELRRESRMFAEPSRRRATERHAFACRQWIAMYDDENHPDERTFREVDCCDLSTGGFSFLVPELPRADRLCIRLGAPGAYVFMNALVVHCSPVETDGGAPGFVLGCRFTARSEAKANPVMEPALN